MFWRNQGILEDLDTDCKQGTQKKVGIEITGSQKYTIKTQE